jgi:hypothetical protein
MCRLSTLLIALTRTAPNYAQQSLVERVYQGIENHAPKAREKLPLRDTIFNDNDQFCMPAKQQPPPRQPASATVPRELASG